ncbi:MAG: PhzF family phenazine biosynthesis protein [Notoacmeibacter sp.]|nr:PhzF family phenazine biosynthesis protein [Notoacmeibacter sp.]
MSSRDYAIYDVFTDRALAGNPLAVVFDADGLDTPAMQAIAREFNLSETVFVQPAEKTMHSARLRIFTPKAELPFAGHPTVGAAIAIVERGGERSGGTALVALEETIGLVRAAVRHDGPVRFAEFDLPKLPEPAALDISREAVASALGLDIHDTGFENHVISAWSAGVPFVCVPVHGLDAAGRARMSTEQWLDLFAGLEPVKVPSPWVYCRETVNHDCAFHARMFAPHFGVTEDPATGSAVAAFAGAIAQFDEPVDGLHSLWIEQGIEMGRASRLRLELDMDRGRLARARIGGHAVKVAEGSFFA